MDSTERGTWYPAPPPHLPGETADTYTDRLTGADRTGRSPYNHSRKRQCSIGYHNECSDPAGATCKCPHHTDPGPGPEPIPPVVVDAAAFLAGLWCLPTTTAQRVMAVVHDLTRNGRPGEVLADIRRRLDTLYDTTVSDGFLTDVVTIYADVCISPGQGR